jgi:sugar lactone lactonase YvrE
MTWNKLTTPVRPFAAGSWIALFALLALCLGAPAYAQTPIVVSGTPTQLGALTGGGWDGSQEPIGGTFVVGLNGDVLIGDGWNSAFLQITPSGTDTKLVPGYGASNAALDSYGNLYFGGNYNASVFKIPYNAATGQYVGFTTAPTANCLGGNQDTAPCLFAPAVVAYMNGTLAGSGASGYAGMVFDAQGNFFFESNTLPGTNPNSIFECNVACLASSTATPTLIYADKNPVGALAIDPWGNLFFVDGKASSKGDVTNINEIPLSSGAYAASPTVVESYTTAVSWGNGISGLAISGTGTVYFCTNADGIFAFPNTQSGGPDTSALYMLATQGGKGLAIDSKGNLYGIPYNSGDVVSFIPVGSVALGASPTGAAATAVSATIFDSAASCTKPPTLALSVTEFGKATSEFTAAAGTTCSTPFGGANGVFSSGPLTAAGFSSFPVTANFTPTAVGERNAALTIADAANSASGTAALSGVGQGATGNVDPGVITAVTTGLTSPASIVGDPAGDLFIADPGAGKVYEIASGSSTLTPVGTGFVTPDALAFDANGNLFIADDGALAVEEILNTGATGAFVAGTQSTVVKSTTLFDGAALSSATGLAFAPNGTLYISDTAGKRVVFWDPLVGQAGVTLATTANGVKSPTGLAVDSSGNLYVADSTLDQVFEFASAGGITAITPPNVSEPAGVAVDASGSLLVADAGSGNIVWIPNVSGTLTTSAAVTIETLSPQASSLWLDAQGDAYVASAGGQAAYAIQRTAASVNLGTVQDGVTNSATVYLISAGNQSATLATPDVTEPSNTMFTLDPAASNGCSSGLSGAPGTSCQFTATFAPPPATADGVQSGTATINIATPAGTINVNLSGTATTSSIKPQTITGFKPPASIEEGQQITLSAKGGASGNPVTFSIDAASACPACATITGSVLTAVSTGVIKVDANQAGGTAGGTQYAAATQVQATITINNNVVPPGVPALLMNQINWLLALPNGGAYGGTGAGGSTFVVNPAGNPVVGTSYGNEVALFDLKTGAWTNLGSVSSVAGIAQNSAGDLYLGASYSNTIAKLPYNSSTGTYATLTDFTKTAPPQCTGKDTTECSAVTTFANWVGVGSMTVDASGNLFIATDDQGTPAHAIFECSAACQTGASAPVLLFQETATSITVGGTDYAIQYYIGGIAVDPWDNLFFTDSAVVTGGSGESATSHLYELAYTAATGYATAPTVIQTFTNTKPGSYDDQLSAVAIAPNGDVYYGVGYDGIFGVPNTQAGPQIANQYGVVSQGPKEMAVDSNGNVYWVAYNNGGDSLGQALVGNLTTPNAQYQGASVSATATVVDNALGCGTAATIAIASSNPEFSATAGTTCSSLSVGSGNGTLSTPISASTYPATITFQATKPNSQNATLTVTDTTNGGEGTATVTGFALTTPQTLTFTAPTTTTYTYSPGMTITLGVANGGSNNPAVFTVDTSSTGTGTISGTTVEGTTSAATFTVTQAGSIVIDATEPGGLVNGTYYDAAPQVQLPLTINPAAQVIVFPQPNSPVTYTANPNTTVSLSANGGDSGNPVVFTVDSTSTGTGTVSTSTLSNGTSSATLTVTGAGNIIIDANQVGNADYLAAAQVQQTIVVNQAAQTITFAPLTQNFYYIVTGATLSIQATGGGSDQAIVFTVDKSSTMKGSFSASTLSGATSTTTLTMPANQSPASGTIVVDANQPGNTNYLAATLTQMTITVGAPLPTQTITFPLPQTQVGGTTLTLTATTTSGFPIMYSSSTPSVCTVSGSVATFASVTSASTCTITASQPGDNLYFAAAFPVTVSFTVNPAGQTPAMNLSVSLPSLTIEPGTVGLTQISVTSQNNFTGSVAFACGGLPTGYSCSFNPNPINVAEGGTTTTTLTVTPASTTAMIHRNSMPLFPATLAAALCFLGFKKRNRLQRFLMLAVLFTGLGLISACGGTSSSSTTKPVTSTITITATSGSMQVSSTMSITLE